MTPDLRERMADDIYRRIEHGDEAHRAWLKEKSREVATSTLAIAAAALRERAKEYDVSTAWWHDAAVLRAAADMMEEGK